MEDTLMSVGRKPGLGIIRCGLMKSQRIKENNAINAGEATSSRHHALLSRDFNEMVVQCKILAWLPDSNALSSLSLHTMLHLICTWAVIICEGKEESQLIVSFILVMRNILGGNLAANFFRWLGCTVLQYNNLLEKHTVCLRDGFLQRVNIFSGPIQPATRNSQNQELERSRTKGQSDGKFYEQACKRSFSAPCETDPGKDDAADGCTYVSKKCKGQSVKPVFKVTKSSVRTNCSKLKDDKYQASKNTASTPSSVTSTGESSNETVDINGYKVKATAAAMLEGIFTKYGDITANCVFKSPLVRAPLLEVVCDIVQKLQNYNSDAILLNLEPIKNEISDVEAAKIDVSWLSQHLSEFREVSAFHKENLLLKSSKENMGLVITEASEISQQYNLEWLLAAKRVKEAKKYVNVMKLVVQKIDDDILACED